MQAVIEIRIYQLHEGSAALFHRTMMEQSLALLRAAGTDVVAARPCLEDPCAYMIVRAYPSRAEREASQATFYGGDAWINGPRDIILGCIASYHTVVVDAEPSLTAAMRRLEA